MGGGRSRFLLLLLLIFPSAAAGQVVVKVSDDVQFRLGTLIHGWGDWTQDPVSEGYAANLFLRRVRLCVAGNIARNVSFFFQTENARLGNAGLTGAKNLTTGFLVQDAFGEWRFAGDAAMLDAGLFYTPQSRTVLTGSSSVLSFDSPTFGQQQTGPLQGSSGRDVGLQLKGYILGERLEYRVGVFDGQRQPATPAGAGSRNPFRSSARVQYNFFDIEKGYTYVGTNRGAKKILVVGAWGDTQGDYRGYGADINADIPIGKDAVTAEFDYLLYDGGRELLATSGTPLLPRLETVFTQAGYYFNALRLQPFLRFETLNFREVQFQGGNQRRYACGFNWYVAGQNFKITPFYERIVPNARATAATIKNTNHFGIQLQFYYF